MPMEREIKFVIAGDINDIIKKRHINMKSIVQKYISTDINCTTRIRIVGGQAAFITIKGKRVLDSCPEFEYEIPIEDARQIIGSIPGNAVIDKMRYSIDIGSSHPLEIDVFDGANYGLIIAELELLENEEIPCLPEYIGSRIDTDPHLMKITSNSSLARYPFCSWTKDEVEKWNFLCTGSTTKQ